MKKIVAFCIVFFLCFSLIPMEALAATQGDYEYEIINGEATITGYIGSGGAIVIPSSLGGKPVTAIGDDAFNHCENLTNVTIPQGVTTIGDHAFFCCESLTGIIVPGSVITIGDYAFCACESLTDITISEGVTTIGKLVFADCDNLTVATIPDSVTTIGAQAFGYKLEFGSINRIRDNDFIMRGFSGSAAQTYAEEYGVEFEDVAELVPVLEHTPGLEQSNNTEKNGLVYPGRILAVVICAGLLILFFIIRKLRKKGESVLDSGKEFSLPETSQLEESSPFTDSDPAPVVVIPAEGDMPTVSDAMPIPVAQRENPSKGDEKVEGMAAVALQHHAKILETVWPEWKLEKELGRGSYGVVYQAVRTDSSLGSRSAIKVVSIPSNTGEVASLQAEGLDDQGIRTYFQGITQDFIKEIQVMEWFKGMPNMVSVEDYKVVEQQGQVGFDIFIRMELLTSFDAFVKQNALTPQEVVRLGIDICSALEICNRQNVIHRDIKPENIFVNQYGYYKLGDFGIARTLENATAGLSQKGTYNYMAPEVANSNHYDHRVDIYSLGLVLHRLLNDMLPPFVDSENRMNAHARKLALDRRLQGEQIPPPLHATPQLSRVILKACDYDPDKRYVTAGEMKVALEQVARGGGEPQQPATPLDATVSVRSVRG